MSRNVSLKMSRRRLLKTCFGASVGVIAGSGRVSGGESAEGVTENVPFLREHEGLVREKSTQAKFGGSAQRWTTSFAAADGTIHLHGGHRSVDGGRNLIQKPVEHVDRITDRPEGAVLARPGLFLAVDGPIEFQSPGTYRVRTWRSDGQVEDLQAGWATVRVPGGPTRARKNGEWFGLYFHRTILDMEDGTLLATAQGNLAKDNVTPLGRSGTMETSGGPMQRSMLLRSEDGGRNWSYMSTIAAPEPGDPLGEGFGEPTMARLKDGALLCVMRTGHYHPLYATWSRDGGENWSEPLYTGMDRGCDPCLLRSSAGFLALTYGRRYPEGWSRVRSDRSRWKYPGSGVLKLAISPDGTGRGWQQTTVGTNMGSCYSTIIEVEPGTLFCQVDGWCWRMKLHA